MNILKRIDETKYVHLAIEDKADLCVLKKLFEGRARNIGYPAVGALATLSIYLEKLLIIAIGGPTTCGLSQVVFLLGMYLAGADYTRICLC